MRFYIPGFRLYKWCVCLNKDEYWCPAERQQSLLIDSSEHPGRQRHSCSNLFLLPGHPSSTFPFAAAFPSSPHIYSTFSVVLIYRQLRFNALFLGEVSVLVSDLMSPVLLIPEDFNLHMDVTSDNHPRIHSLTWFSPAVSADSSICSEGLCFWFH